MATTSDCSYHAIFRFTVDVPKLTLDSIESPEVKLSNANWKVKLQKASIGDNNKDVLSVHLVSEFEDNTVSWSCAAQATFKLIQKDCEMEQSIVKYLPKQKFSNVKRSHGFDEFVDWDEFLEHFVDEENRAALKVEISTEPSIRTIGLGVDREYARFRVTIENIDKLGSCFSTETVVRGIRWKLNAEKDGDSLELYLYGDEEDMDINWSYEVELTFQLLSFDKKVAPVKRSMTHDFLCGLSNWGFTEFIKWDVFMNTDKRYVRDNRAIIDVELKVNEPEPQWKIAEYKLSKENSLLLCIICLECFSSGKIFSTKCGHLFCKPCFDKSIEKRQTCPNCNAATSADELRPIFFA